MLLNLRHFKDSLGVEPASKTGKATKTSSDLEAGRMRLHAEQAANAITACDVLHST